MNEASAREVLLLQAFESVVPASPQWAEEDRAWATRLALQEPSGNTADPGDFLSRRARHAVQRLLPRLPTLAAWLGRRFWRPGWMGVAAVLGAAVGLFADAIGSSQRINLLAPPVWAVVAWNVVVYLALIAGVVARLLSRRKPPRSGALVGLIVRSMRMGARLPSATADGRLPDGSAAALRDFGARWLRASAPLAGLRATALLHIGAAALGAGLIAGLYARGLVLDYRAAWESTFLSAEGVHRLLDMLLGPASRLSGIGLPDAAGLAALRAVHGSASPGAPAAPWIHLYALTLLATVVLPRAVLAALCAWRARRRSARFPLPLTEPYFQRLLRQQSGEVARVQVLPYGRTPGRAAIAGLQRLLTEALGDSTAFEVAPTTAFGGEDEPPPPTTRPVSESTTLRVALFDLTATPEAEHHAAFARALASRAPAGAATIVCVDEAAFRQRFGATGPRLGERRAAWTRLADSLATVAVIADLEAAGTAAQLGALSAAIARPVQATVGRVTLDAWR